ncbi:MAG: class C beta-lactamase-related serine hydrolase [Chitinophagaceae bacterium]|nr:MAG: class C beta-lactamase-related serine hydrolase [Chitinophagaceae bacterium]
MTLSSRSICLKVSTVATFLLIFQSSHAQLSQMDTASLSGLMEQKARLLRNNNLVLAVASKDTIVYKNDTKFFNVGRGQGEAGYISEWFTTALALMLVDEGKFALDDKVVDYLPEFGKYGKNYITIRHCLTHNTGIQVPSKPELFDSYKGESFEKVANSLASKEIQTNPGTEFRYSDRGYYIVAAIIEKVTKRKFEQLMSQRLFRPLGMRGSGFLSLDGSLVSPAFGAKTTAADLTSFGRLLLNGGNWRGQQLLQAESVEQFRALVTPAADVKGAPREALGHDYALGGWVLEAGGNKATALAMPSFGGTAAVIDFCRGYVFAYLLKETDKDKKAEALLDIKATIDGGAEVKCQ